MAYDKTNDFEAVQSDVLTTDTSTNSKISKLKQLKTDTKVPTKAINATYEQLGNAQASAADALQRVGAFENGMIAVTERVDAFEADVTEQITALRNSSGMPVLSDTPVTIESDVLNDINKLLRDTLHAEHKDVVAWTGYSGGTPENYATWETGVVEVPHDSDINEFLPTHVTGVTFSNAASEDVPIFWDTRPFNNNKSGNYPLSAQFGLGYYSAEGNYPNLVYHVGALGRLSLANWFDNNMMIDDVSFATEDNLTVLGDYEITALNNALKNNSTVVSVPDLTLVDCSSATYAFDNCTNLTTVGDMYAPSGDVAQISNTNYMFHYVTKLTRAPKFNVTSSCSYMFYGCTGLVDASNVQITGTTADYAFQNCTSLTVMPQIGRNMTMCGMFKNCTALSAVTGWLRSSNFVSMFENCTSLPETLPAVIDISLCTDESKFKDMFKDTPVTTIKVFSDNGVSTTFYPSMFSVQTLLVVDELGEVIETRDANYIPNKAINNMYSSTGTYSMYIPEYMSNVYVETISGFGVTGTINPTSTVYTSSFDSKITSLTPTMYTEGTNYMHTKGQDCNSRGYYATFGSIRDESVSDLANGLLRASGVSLYTYNSSRKYDCYGGVKATSDHLAKGTCEVTPNSTALITVGGSSVSGTMYYSGSSACGYVGVHWDDRLDTPVNPTGDDVVTCTNTSYKMSVKFSNSYTTMTELPNRLNTHNLGVANNMFSGCAALQTLDMSEMDFGKTLYANNMFKDCAALQVLDTTALEYMAPISASYMFSNCTALQEINLKFNALKTSSMTYMFSGCTALTKVTLMFDFGNKPTLTSMFSGCTSLHEVDLTNCVQLHDTSSLFANLSTLKTVKLPNFFAPSGSLNNMFANDGELTTIDGVINLEHVTSYTDMFKDCFKLTGVKIKNPPAGITEMTGFAGLKTGQYEIVE